MPSHREGEVHAVPHDEEEPIEATADEATVEEADEERPATV